MLTKMQKAQIIARAKIIVNLDGSPCTAEDIIKNDSSGRSMINTYWIIANNVLAARGAK